MLDSINKISTFISVNNSKHEGIFVISINMRHKTITVHPDNGKGVNEDFYNEMIHGIEITVHETKNTIWIGPFGLTESIGYAYLLKNQLKFDEKTDYAIRSGHRDSFEFTSERLF